MPWAGPRLVNLRSLSCNAPMLHNAPKVAPTHPHSSHQHLQWYWRQNHNRAPFSWPFYQLHQLHPNSPRLSLFIDRLLPRPKLLEAFLITCHRYTKNQSGAVHHHKFVSWSHMDCIVDTAPVLPTNYPPRQCVTFAWRAQLEVIEYGFSQANNCNMNCFYVLKR